MISEPLFHIIDPREELAFFFRAWLRSRSSDLVRLKIADLFTWRGSTKVFYTCLENIAGIYRIGLDYRRIFIGETPVRDFGSEEMKYEFVLS
jgi:hypothetical protein